MTFNGNGLVDSLASDFGRITSRADKLFYCIGLSEISQALLLGECKNREFS